MDGMKRIYVSGIGVATRWGKTAEVWDRVKKGIAFRKDRTDSSFEPDCTGLLNEAFSEAIMDAGIDKTGLEKSAFILSSSKGNIKWFGRGYDWFLKSISFPDMADCVHNRMLLNVITACATGLHSVIMGCLYIANGGVDTVVCGTVDCCESEFMITGYRKLGVLSGNGCMRPYDIRRDGFWLSEGAGAVVLQSEGGRKKLAKDPYALITGWSMVNETTGMVNMDLGGRDISEGISIAMKRAGMKTVDYINTHGTATYGNDIAETNAIKTAFGQKAYNIPVSTFKPVTGHMLGASGMVEFILSLLALKEGFIPPTANLEVPDPLCDLNYTMGRGRVYNIKSVMKLSYGFGGHIGVVVAEMI